MASIAIDIDRERLAELCRRHHIRRLALFGSVLRPDFRSDSDVDVLVEFAPGHTPGFAFFSIQEELSDGPAGGASHARLSESPLSRPGPGGGTGPVCRLRRCRSFR